MIKISKLKIFLSLCITSLLCSWNGYDKQLGNINITGTTNNSTQNTISEETTNDNSENIIPEQTTEDTAFEQVTFSGKNEYLNDLLQRAREGDIWSINYIGGLYYDGDIQDYDKALKWFNKGAKLGSAVSQYNLGWMYEKGEGAKQNYDEALKFYSMAAEQNFPQAICALAYMSYKGYGKSIDYDEAYKLFLKAAGGLDSDGMSNIGHMYKDGTGLEKDMDKAHMWYKISADNDSDSKAVYDSLDLLYDNEEDNQFKRFIKQPPFNSKTIPDSLILEAQKYMFSSNPYYLLEKYSINNYVSIDDLKNGVFKTTKKLKKNLWSLTGHRYSWYYADLDNDGKDELIFFTMQGSIGISDFRVIRQNDNGQYDISSVFNTQLLYGRNNVIKYDDKYYFAIIFLDSLFHYPSRMEIYSFDGVKLDGVVSIENRIDIENINYMKAYKSENFTQGIENFVDSEIENIMKKTIDTQHEYIGDEYKLNKDELEDIDFLDKSERLLKPYNIYTADINNDGINEYFHRLLWLPSSANGQNNLIFELYIKDDNDNMKIVKIKDYIKDEYISDYLQQLFIKKFGDENYIFLLSQKEYSKNFNLCVYKMNDKHSELISSYLISCPFSDIEIDIKDTFIPVDFKG